MPCRQRLNRGLLKRIDSEVNLSYTASEFIPYWNMYYLQDDSGVTLMMSSDSMDLALEIIATKKEAIN